MGVKRYELSEAQWVRITLTLSGKVVDHGGSGVDNRLFVNGFRGLCGPQPTGSTCRSVLERRSVHARFTRWAKVDVWEEVFVDLIGDRDNMLDTTLVRVHQQPASGKGSQNSGAGAFARRVGQHLYALRRPPPANDTTTSLQKSCSKASRPRPCWPTGPMTITTGARPSQT